jgi:protocatechuate 3,4-dioxygenase beta subunit
MRRRLLWQCMLLIGVMLGCVAPWQAVAAPRPDCTPTPPDALGPFYQPAAPERDNTGQGLVLSGTVRAAGTCIPLSGAQIEWWAANVSGTYDNAHRATQYTATNGAYRYETDAPGRYPGRPLHLHVRITAPGYRPLVTQVYPKQGQTTLMVDLVLTPE